MARRLVTFHLDRHWCGVDVETVQEVASFDGLTRVPLAQDAVVGLANLRGHIMTLLDLRRTLELRPLDGAPSRKAVVLDEPDGSIALLVDRVAGVVEVSEDDFEPPPETLRGPVRERILGAFKLPAGLLLVLNLRGVLEAVGRGDGTDPGGDGS